MSQTLKVPCSPKVIRLLGKTIRVKVPGFDGLGVVESIVNGIAEVRVRREDNAYIV